MDGVARSDDLERVGVTEHVGVRVSVRARRRAAAPAEPVDPVSLQALMAKEYDGRALRTRQVLLRTGDYTRYAVTYRSGDLRISGIMNVPRGKGPFPVLVLLHGYIDPAIYNTGQGLMREQDYLAREGYVALHIDYRGHAGSDPAPRAEQSLRLGYTVDAINAVHAVRRSTLPYLDGERVGYLGRSMGGGVVYNALVAQPGLVDAAVAFAPVSSDTVDNFNRWTRPERGDVAADIIREHGSPERNPDFWRDVSPRTFFDQITEPLLIHHGTVGRQLSLPLEPHLAARPRGGRGQRAAAHLPGRGARLRPAVAALDAPHGCLPGPAAERLTGFAPGSRYEPGAPGTRAVGTPATDEWRQT